MRARGPPPVVNENQTTEKLHPLGGNRASHSFPPLRLAKGSRGGGWWWWWRTRASFALVSSSFSPLHQRGPSMVCTRVIALFFLRAFRSFFVFSPLIIRRVLPPFLLRGKKITRAVLFSVALDFTSKELEFARSLEFARFLLSSGAMYTYLC